ncbi:LA2681 family HEPN domain-containing protein [uncultured Sulfitobacter sp.]|uniref:LA2681 family HEPN domain-containing protein n=1 Tax=uncultured Sulfitobacter sp. TaxID=191468 RepID=UPI0030DC26B0|tara:strand:- start:38305 stop:39798 length:1494 start_codon:yes stop_codon:yes gene_type:complete
METNIELLGLKIDQSIDAKDAEELRSLIKVCRARLVEVESSQRVDLNYFIANAYSGLWRIRSDVDGTWDWKAHETVQEILALRRAIDEQAFEQSTHIRQCQIRTNLANSLSGLGRTVEAIEEYSKVLKLDATFAMALGNRAYAMITYSWYLYDTGHQCVILDCALNDYRNALQPTAFWDSGFEARAADQFAEKLTDIKSYLNDVGFDNNIHLASFSLGETHKEVEYRRWCLSNHLFLNPLNDVMDKSIAAKDVLHLPSHSYQIDEEARFPTYYNILKQEYVSARYHLFESRCFDEDHMVDREVLLFESFDYGQLDFRTEQLKLAFRSAYSILDKVALFLNDYFHIGLRAKQVSFRQVWETQVKGRAMELRSPFVGTKNLPLRGLYFLSKDFFDDDFVEVASPDARGLADLRNFAEHKFLTLTDFRSPQAEDEQHRHISREDFALKTMRVIKMARASLIYLSMAMYREEQIRSEAKLEEETKISVPILSVVRKRHTET